VIALREHFYSVNEVPHLSCVVHYQDAVVPQAALEQSRLVPARPQPSSAKQAFFARRKGPRRVS